jgi:hypothetical protein
MLKRVINANQAARIYSDVIHVMAGKRPEEWTGNSYQGFESGYGEYMLMHWSTPIAVIRRDVGIVYFNATYISSTTRGFQSRILSALTGVFGTTNPAIRSISAELGKPTGERGVIGKY